jgi:hypothetical protein
MAGSNHERILAAEWLAVMGTQTLDALSSSSGGFALPDPSRYFATMVVFVMLAMVAMFGEKPGKLAAAFGGVAALAIVVAPGKNGGKSPVVGALGYFSSLMKSGPNTPNPGTPVSSVNTGNIPPDTFGQSTANPPLADTFGQ